MSESTGGTSASTGAPAPSAPAESSSPAPNSQQPISISDAARLLNSQRRREAGEAPAAPADPGRKPAPSEVAREAATHVATQVASPTSTPAPAKPATGLSAMEKALGLPDGLAPPPESSPPSGAQPAADPAAGFEIEGRRYTQAELRAEVMKAADYTRKTQELSQQRQALQAQQEALATVLPYIQPELARLAQTVQNAPARPDPALLETNPQQYLRDRAAWEGAMEEQNRLAGLTQLQQQAAARAMEAQVADANEKLAAKYPFWSDPGERLKAQQQIVEWATTKGGFSQNELRGLSSPHHLETMMKASMFDRWVESARTNAPAALAAPVRGVAPPPALSERVAQAQDRFDAKPDWRTGAALLAARRAGTNGQAR
jgi:hypothetical protein